MKTNVKFQSIVITIAFLLYGLIIKAQPTICPGTGYPINNLRSCDVAIHYEVSDCGSGGIICYSAYQLIPANSSFILPCCFTSGDVFVWLIEVDGVDVSGAGSTVSGNCLVSQGTSTFGSGTTSCFPVVYNLAYFASYVDIW